MMMIMVVLVRYLLFGLFLYLCGRLLYNILTEYIFNPALYKAPQCESQSTQVAVSVCQKKAS